MTFPTELENLLTILRKERNFVPELWIDKKVAIFNDWMQKCGLKGCVISISGGIDSAVTLALIHRAMKRENSPIKRVVAICQPIHSTKSIWERALELSKYDGVEIVTVDQSDIFNQLKSTVDNVMDTEGNHFVSGQLKSYMRTPVNYYTAQLLSQTGTPAVVVGTGNYDEDGYLFYFSKCGDGCTDVQLISDLHKSEVFSVGVALGVPESILGAPPSADLWEGQTDEEELGFSYSFVELYTELIQLPEEKQKELKSHLSEDALKQFTEWELKINEVHRRNNHKAKFPVNL